MGTCKLCVNGLKKLLLTQTCRDADKVDDLLDSIQEQKEIHDTISEAISRPGNEMFDDVRFPSISLNVDNFVSIASGGTSQRT